MRTIDNVNPNSEDEPMSEKEQRVAMLHADLMAGRIKVPEQGAWMREYLGEWKDPPPGPLAIAVESSIGIHAVRCESCGLAFTGATASEANFHAKAHHAVCTARSIAVGDYVRWEFERRGIWAEGEVTAWMPKHHRQGAVYDCVTIRVARHCGNWSTCNDDPVVTGREHLFGCEARDGITVRRIPRPAEAPATVPVFPAGADRSKPCPTCGENWGAHYGIACSTMDRERPCSACGDPLGDHLKFVGCRGPGSKPTACAPAPALVDGIDREACLARWMENRLAIEGGAAPPNAMTCMQIDVGRRRWLQTYGAAWAAELRLKIIANREAERNRVRVTPEYDPCD